MAPSLWASFKVAAILLLTAVGSVRQSQALTPELCDKMCSMASVFCWFCGIDSLAAEDVDDDGAGSGGPGNDPPPVHHHHHHQQPHHFRQQKVIGGHPIAYGQEMGYVVGLGKNYGGSRTNFCGGTLVTDKHVVTAAHCVANRPVGDFVVFAGDYNRYHRDEGEVAVAVARKYIHPAYTFDGYHHDVAVLELADSLKFSKYISPALIAAKHLKYGDGTSFEVAGWGTTSKTYNSNARQLRKARVSYVNPSDCRRDYYDYFHRFTATTVTRQKPEISTGMVCAGDHGTDSCMGDSGGPMVGYFGLHDFIDFDWLRNFIRENVTLEEPNEDEDDILEAEAMSNESDDSDESSDESSDEPTKTELEPEPAVTEKVKVKKRETPAVDDLLAIVDNPDDQTYLFRDFDLAQPLTPRSRGSKELSSETDPENRARPNLADFLNSFVRHQGRKPRLVKAQQQQEQPAGNGDEEVDRDHVGDEFAARFLFPEGVPNKATKVAIQTMINAGIQASILNAMSMFHAMQQENSAIIQQQLQAALQEKDFPAEGIESAMATTMAQPVMVKKYPVKVPMTVEQARSGAVPTLVGVVSWGHGCAVLPGVYTDVRVYRDWIVDVIGGEPQIEVVFQDTL